MTGRPTELVRPGGDVGTVTDAVDQLHNVLIELADIEAELRQLEGLVTGTWVGQAADAFCAGLAAAVQDTRALGVVEQQLVDVATSYAEALGAAQSGSQRARELIDEAAHEYAGHAASVVSQIVHEVEVLAGEFDAGLRSMADSLLGYRPSPQLWSTVETGIALEPMSVPGVSAWLMAGRTIQSAEWALKELWPHLPTWLRHDIDRGVDDLAAAIVKGRTLLDRSLFDLTGLIGSGVRQLNHAAEHYLGLGFMPTFAPPPKVRDDAVQVPLRTTTIDANANLGLKAVSASTEEKIQETEYKGYVEVTITATGLVGVGDQKSWAGASVGGTGSMTYRFATKADADAFIRGFLAAQAAGGAQADLYLAACQPNLVDMTVQGTEQAAVGFSAGDVGGGHVDVGADVQVSVGSDPLTHQNVYDATIESHAAGGFVPGGVGHGVAGHATGSINAQLRTDYVGHPQELTLSGDWSATAGGANGLWTTEHGHGGTWTMTVDLANPGAQAAAERLLKDLGMPGGTAGNPSDIAAAMKALEAHSTIVTTATDETVHAAGVDAVVGGVDVTTTTATATSSTVVTPRS